MLTSAPPSPDAVQARLDALAAGARAEHTLAQQALGKFVSHAIRCGELLLDIKELLPHGAFQPWVREHFPASYDTAAAYMRVARNRSKVERAQPTSLRQALAAIAPPKREQSARPAYWPEGWPTPRVHPYGVLGRSRTPELKADEELRRRKDAGEPLFARASASVEFRRCERCAFYGEPGDNDPDCRECGERSMSGWIGRRDGAACTLPNVRSRSIACGDRCGRAAPKTGRPASARNPTAPPPGQPKAS